MPLHDFAELSVLVAVFLLGLSVAILIVPGQGSAGPMVIFDLFDPKDRKGYRKDFRETRVAFKGMLSLLFCGAILGTALCVLGGILLAVDTVL